MEKYYDEPLNEDEYDNYYNYELFYAMEKEEAEAIDKIRMSYSINPWELIAIAIGLDRTAKRHYYSKEHETPYYGEPTPDWWIGTRSLAKKIGLHLFNPYSFYEFVSGKWSYEELIKYLGYEVDEYGLVWYTEEEKANIGKETTKVDYQEQSEIILPPEQVASMNEILGIL
ncbi:MAG: hypothetical protein KIT33_10440 [Candidatus Kapabacteria bacterium]|nr:hypothetical protein [Ignavibacteriota bacterium]MCW5885377.1 hypothetical protein [Candidatus Kapabacteria bacterium]